MKKYLICFVAASLLSLLLPAQNIRQVLAGAGGTYRSTELCMAWTLGQPFIGGATAGQLTLQQGFQQPDDAACKIVTTATPETFEVRVFPNPVVETLHVRMTSLEENLWYAHLLNGFGQLILEMPLRDDGADISMAKLPPALYVLSLFEQRTGLQKTFKILKTKE